MAKSFLVGSLFVAAALQLAWSARLVHASFVRAELVASMLGDTAPSVPGEFSQRAWRSLRGLDVALPEDARVLFVTSMPVAIGWEYFLLPRPTRTLQQVDLSLRNNPVARQWFGDMIDEFVVWLDARGRLWTKERVRAGIAWADYVIEFVGGLEPDDLIGLKEVRRQEDVAVFAVEKAGARR
jgi:hypothetical protein